MKIKNYLPSRVAPHEVTFVISSIRGKHANEVRIVSGVSQTAPHGTKSLHLPKPFNDGSCLNISAHYILQISSLSHQTTPTTGLVV